MSQEAVSAHVVGVPDETTGEAVVAFRVLREPAGAQPESELEDEVRGHLGASSVPSAFTVIDRLPHTPGKSPAGDRPLLLVRDHANVPRGTLA
nr:hypothetical protein [Kineosporia mesophila]